MSGKEPAIEKAAEEAARDAEQGLTGVAPPDGRDHKKRTLGNKIFDLAVWPTIAFGAVFAFSVWATHKAKFGSGWAKDRFNGLADFVKTTPLVNKSLTEAKINKQAEDHAMVLVSFIAGTVLMAPVKWLEDARGRISKKIDARLGTTPDDPSHYATEPRQSWGSVLGGRAITFGSILLFSKVVGKYIDTKSQKVADWLKGIKVDDTVSKEAMETALKEARQKAGKSWEYAYVGAFEGFYSALCAVSVYALSRGLARCFNKEEEKPAAVAAQPVTAAADDPDAKNVSWREKAAPRQKPQKAEGFVSVVDDSRAGLGGQPALS